MSPSGLDSDPSPGACGRRPPLTQRWGSETHRGAGLGWPRAEAIGGAGPHGVPRLLIPSAWDRDGRGDGLRDALAAHWATSARPPHRAPWHPLSNTARVLRDTPGRQWAARERGRPRDRAWRATGLWHRLLVLYNQDRCPSVSWLPITGRNEGRTIAYQADELWPVPGSASSGARCRRRRWPHATASRSAPGPRAAQGEPLRVMARHLPPVFPPTARERTGRQNA
jgi:hypothetical protein